MHLVGSLIRLKQLYTPFINQLQNTMMQPTIHVFPFWVRIELNDFLGGLNLENNSPPSCRIVRAYAALAGCPLEALLEAIEQFMDSFPHIEPGDLQYRVHPLGIDGRPIGGNFLPADDKEVAELKILHKSTSRRLPLKNFTAFFSFRGRPWMFSEVIQVRSVTHAALALLHRTRTGPFDFGEPCTAFNIYQGIHVPVDCFGKEFFQLDGFRYEAYKGIPVVDEEIGSDDGFTIVEHAIVASQRYTTVRGRKAGPPEDGQPASFTLKGKVVDRKPEIVNALFSWEISRHNQARCIELPDTDECWVDAAKADS